MHPGTAALGGPLGGVAGTRLAIARHMQLESAAWRAVGSEDFNPGPGATPRGDGTLVAQLEAVVRAAPGADLATIARALGMSTRSLQRTLSARDTSFNAVRDRVRLSLARHHLTDPTYKIEAVAREIGFASTGHFCQWFRKRTGVSPGASRSANRQSRS